MNGPNHIDSMAFTNSGNFKRYVCFSISIFLMLFVSIPAFASIQDNWQFDVYLDDKPIGEHSFVVTEKSGLQTIRTQASFDVKVLFVTAFSYRHDNVEVWQNGCLQQIDAKTKINGKLSIVEGTQRNTDFLMLANDKTESLEGCVSTFAYWDQKFLNNSSLLNSQTGELEPVVVSKSLDDTFLVGDTLIPATRYELVVNNNPISLWYAQNGRWLGLETLAKGGRVLRYQPSALPKSGQLASAD